jgi:hypothetical protein
MQTGVGPPHPRPGIALSRSTRSRRKRPTDDLGAELDAKERADFCCPQ